MTKTIYLIGNLLLDHDNLPLRLQKKLGDSLPQFDFQCIDVNENLKPDADKALYFIDSVEGIEDVIVITDLAQIQNSPKYSLHDFDLGFNLKLLKKIGLLERVMIFGVPMTGCSEKIFADLVNQIQKHL